MTKHEQAVNALTPADREKIQTLAGRFVHGREMMGSIWQNCEIEVIITQTLFACDTRLKEGGEPYSVNEMEPDSPLHGIFNHRGLRRLVEEGYMVEGVVGAEKTIIPTRKLLDAVESHLNRAK